MSEIETLYGGDRIRRVVLPVDEATIAAMGRVRKRLARIGKRKSVTLASASRAMMALGIAMFGRIDAIQ